MKPKGYVVCRIHLRSDGTVLSITYPPPMTTQELFDEIRHRNVQARFSLSDDATQEKHFQIDQMDAVLRACVHRFHRIPSAEELAQHLSQTPDGAAWDGEPLVKWQFVEFGPTKTFSFRFQGEPHPDFKP